MALPLHAGKLYTEKINAWKWEGCAWFNISKDHDKSPADQSGRR